MSHPPSTAIQRAIAVAGERIAQLEAEDEAPEGSAGLRQQQAALGRIAAQLSRDPDPLHSAEGASGIFQALRDAYSLAPENEACAESFRALAQAQSGSAAAALAAALSGSLVVLHISCRAKSEQALASVASFGAHGQERHLVVVANDQPTGLGFEYANGLLTLSTGDAYEHLADKLFLSLLVLHLCAGARGVLKVDDDIRLASRRWFNLWMVASRRLAHHYSGTFVGGHGYHRRHMWHGWHIGKCRDRSYEARGHQLPAHRYAHGGRGYYLSARSIDELAYAYLSHRAFFEAASILSEDASVGLFLDLAGIAGVFVPAKYMGLTTASSPS